MENGMENRNCAINMKYKIDENNNKNVNENIQSYNISYINKNKKETTNSSMEEQTNREIKKEEYMEFSTKNLSEINLYDPITLKNVEDLIENDSKIKNSEVEIKSSIIIELKNREDLSGILHTNEEKKSTIDLYFKEKDQFSELKNNLSDIYSHIKKEKILVDNSQDELKSDENRSEEKIYERSIDKSNDSTNNLINKEDITCDDRTETYKLGNIKMKKELLDDIDKQSNKPFMEFSVIKNGDRNEYSLNNEDSKEIFDDMEKKDRKSKTKNYGEKEGSVEENSHLLKNEKEKESYKVINTLNILQNNKNCNVVNSTKKNTVNNDHDMNNENLILKNKIDVHLNIEEENNKNNIIVMNENEKNTQANIDMNDNNDNAKSCNRKIPVNFKNIILKINDEIKNKINETKENDNLITNKITSKQSILKKFPFPPSLRKNLLVSSEKEEVKNINNNRANLFIEMNFSSDYITLDAVDLDNVVNEGIHNYKKVEESYIESGQYIKDIVIYTDIMRKEEKTLYFCDLNDREEGINEKNNIIIFKTSDQIKNEITKSIGISIFHCINNTIHPSKSLVNDEKLEMWFTKKKREKNDNRSFMESDSSQSLIFKKSKRRLSTMGSFCQPIIIMLSSLKRQSTYNNLKKIITSLILCTCDSASLEKILHTLPEENSKNYLLWKDAINKLYIYIGEKKNEIIKKFLEVKEEDSDENNEDDTCEINEKNKYENFNLKTYDFMRGIGNYNNCLNTSFSSTNTTTYSTSKQKNNVDDSHIYEDEEFCLFICTIKNVHKRLRYLLLIDNFDFIYEDLLKHIKNKLNSIELIMNKHVLLKQLFCNILYLCNWLNEPKMYKWFQWNDVVKQLEKLYGYSDNGKISRERCIMLLLAEHTGEIFTEKELNNLKKISKFHIKDLYDKSIDFINSYLELKNQMNNEEFKQSCCISTDEKSIFSEDKFLEKIKTFVEKNYNKMLFIMWNIVLLINQYLILIIWLGDVRPFYPLFSYIDENRKMKYSHDLFINIILFFESYNKYINIIKKRKETNINEKNVLLKNTDDCYLPPNSFSIKGEKPILSKKNNLNNNFYNYTDSNIINKNKNEKRTYEDKEIKNISKVISRETKKRKSLTNTVDYACEIKRKSLEKENKNFIKKKSLENTCEVEFELSD